VRVLRVRRDSELQRVMRVGLCERACLPDAAAYSMATSRLVVVDMNANSTPPRTLNSLRTQKLSGSRPPAMPR